MIILKSKNKGHPSEHVMQFDHMIDWNNLEILRIESHYYKRLTSEAWLINSHPSVINHLMVTAYP